VLYADGRSRRLGERGQDKGHRAEMAAFLDLLQRGSIDGWTCEDAIVATLGTLAIRDSADLGHRVSIDPTELER
jgi:hypothetical protein